MVCPVRPPQAPPGMPVPNPGPRRAARDEYRASRGRVCWGRGCLWSSEPARPIGLGDVPRSRAQWLRPNRWVRSMRPVDTEVIMVEVDLFKTDVGLPAGLRYRPELLTPDEETGVVALFEGLPFREFEFHGFLGKRRVVSFGWRYDFNGGGLQK